jgi:hypothetical protein
MKRFFPALALVALVGCTSPVTDPAMIESCGPKPSQQIAEAVAAKAVSLMRLKDPESARITEVTVESPMVWKGDPGGPWVGWQIGFYLNAKNSFGGYVGPQRIIVLLRKDGTFRYRPADAWHP